MSPSLAVHHAAIPGPYSRFSKSSMLVHIQQQTNKCAYSYLESSSFYLCLPLGGLNYITLQQIQMVFTDLKGCIACTSEIEKEPRCVCNITFFPILFSHRNLSKRYISSYLTSTTILNHGKKQFSEHLTRINVSGLTVFRLGLTHVYHLCLTLSS